MNEPSSRSRSVRHFLVMEILERAQELESAGRDVVHLEVGEPDFDTPRPAVEAGIDALRSGHTHYTHSMGMPSLRKALASSLGSEHDVDIDPRRILVTVGSSAALVLAFAALLDPGDEVVVSDPGYACYPNIARALGAVPKPVGIRVEDGFVFDPVSVARALGPRTKAVMVNSPSNPTGTITPPEVLRELADLAPALVSDEIYQGLVYEGDAPSALRLDPEAFVVSGFSKRYAMTGWRLGYLVVPTTYVRVVQALQQNLFISASDFGQRAAQAALDATDDLAAMRREFDERRRFLLEALPAIGIDVPVRPQGAFYVFCDVRRYTSDSMAFALELLEGAGVAVTPGIDFGQRGEGWIRLSYATSIERLREGVKRLGEFIAAR